MKTLLLSLVAAARIGGAIVSCLTAHAESIDTENPCIKFHINRNERIAVATGLKDTMYEIYKNEKFIDRGSCYHTVTGAKNVKVHLYATSFMQEERKKEEEYLLDQVKKEKSATEILDILLDRGIIDSEILLSINTK